MARQRLRARQWRCLRLGDEFALECSPSQSRPRPRFDVCLSLICISLLPNCEMESDGHMRRSLRLGSCTVRYTPYAHTHCRWRPSSTLSRAIARIVYPARRKPHRRYGGNCCHGLFPVCPDQRHVAGLSHPNIFTKGLRAANCTKPDSCQIQKSKRCLEGSGFLKGMDEMFDVPIIIFTDWFSLPAGSCQDNYVFKALSERARSKIGSGPSGKLVFHLKVMLWSWRKWPLFLFS